MSKDSSCLIITGNGLDLTIGYKTKYQDYFNFVFKNKESVIYNNNPRNFWFQYFDELKGNNLENWFNVETAIKNILESINNLNEYLVNFESDGPFEYAENNLLFPLKNYKTSEDSYLGKSSIFKLITDRYKLNSFNINTIFDILMEDLNEFEESFLKYISNREVLLQNPFLTKDEYIDYIASDYNVENRYFLNFNYTRVAGNNVANSENVRNIHGSLIKENDNPIIFGIDSDGVNTDSPIYKFTKTSRVLNNSITSKNNANIINNNIKTIKFVGHSLNEADYSYFQSIFDYYSIYDRDINLEFYYTSYQKNQKDELKKYEESITRLIEKYGQTFSGSNTSHGKNLLHKLILENRIKLKYADTNEI